jgi:hypothetical protein
MSPTEALDIAMNFVGTVRRNMPGAIIKRMPQKVRDALSRLTSDDLASLRVPEWVCRTGGRHGRAR